MNARDDYLAILRRQHDSLLEQVAALESGRRKHSEKRGSEWVDITQELLREWRQHVAQIGRLVKMLEAPLGRTRKTAVRASEKMAAEQIDRMLEQSDQPNAVKAKRKKRLLKGPAEFRKKD
jgi:hypothetical protein